MAGGPIIDGPFLDQVVDDMATMSEEPAEGGGGATGAWADRHNVDLGGLVRFLETWVADSCRRDHGAVTQAAYWFQAGYEARRKQQDGADGTSSGGVRWTIERSYPAKADRRPHDQPERWEGTTLRGFADQLEDAASMDRENTSVVVADLVGDLVAKSYLAAGTEPVTTSWEDHDNDDGRLVQATAELEV
ncbi:MAG TPA: hypothetical protein VGK43_02675 [Solirubrobacterales bacterium]